MTPMPDEDDIIEKLLIRPFGFTPEQLSECHRFMWHRYDEDTYFKIHAMRVQLAQIWDELEFEEINTTCQQHLMKDGNREIYAMIALREVYLTASMQNNFSMLVWSNQKSMARYSDDFDRFNRLMSWYRTRARERGAETVDKALRAVLRLIMNLPNEPSVWIVPDPSQNLLAIQVVWKKQLDRVSLTITIADPTYKTF